MAYQIHPPHSLKKTRKSVLRHNRKVFAQLVKALWAEPFFHEMRQVAEAEVLDLLPQYGSPDKPAVDLFDVLVVALKVPGDVGIATATGVFKASAQFEHQANLLAAGLRPGTINLCRMLGVEPSPVHLIWCSTCVLWPAKSVDDLVSTLSDVAGMGLFSVEIAGMALRPEPEVPNDVLRREALDFHQELGERLRQRSPLAVPWTAAGRPQGITEFFRDKADFDTSVARAIKAIRVRKEYPSAERVSEYLNISDVRQLRRYCRTFGYDHWRDVL